MKTFLAFVLFASALHAGEPSYDFQLLKARKSISQIRAEDGPGPCPQVTSDRLPAFIENAIRNHMKDPASMEFIGWTAPELRTTTAAGQPLAWWHMEIKLRAKNSYGGYVVEKYGLMIKQESVTRIVSYNP